MLLVTHGCVLQNYSAFFPTVRNTNINDIAQAAAAGGSVTEYGYRGQNTADDNSTPVDCQYNSSSATVYAIVASS